MIHLLFDAFDFLSDFFDSISEDVGHVSFTVFELSEIIGERSYFGLLPWVLPADLPGQFAEKYLEVHGLMAIML